MTLADRAAQGSPRPIHGYPCSVGHLLATLPDGEADALAAMLGTRQQRGWSARDIYDAVRAQGHTISYQQINRHRGGQCRCEVAA